MGLIACSEMCHNLSLVIKVHMLAVTTRVRYPGWCVLLQRPSP